MDENPYIFLKNNLFLQFLIADRYRIYRHITACVSLLLFFLITKEWGAYKGFVDHLDWIEKWLGVIATFYLNMYVLIPRFFFKGKLATYITILTSWVFFMIVFNYYLNAVLWKDYMIGEEIKMALKTPIFVVFLSKCGRCYRLLEKERSAFALLRHRDARNQWFGTG